jgi:hypothetical protein
VLVLPAGAAAPQTAAPGAAEPPSTASGTGWTGIAGLVAGALALIVSVIALVRTRTGAAPAS